MTEALINDGELEAAIKWCQEKYGESANLTLARCVAIRIKRFYDDPNFSGEFGELIRRALNEIDVSPKSERTKYARVVTRYFRVHAAYVIKNKTRKVRGQKQTLPRPRTRIAEDTSGQFRFDV